MTNEQISIIGAVVAVSFGAIGPALAEGRAVAAAMEAIARQPESAPSLSRLTLEDVRRIGDAVGDPDRVAATVASGQ